MYIKENLPKSNYRVRYSVQDEEQFFPMHFHDGYEILYISSGNGSCIIEGEENKISEGDIIITNPNEAHSIFLCANCERWHISFRTAFLSEFIDENYNPVRCLAMRKAGTNNLIPAKVVNQYNLNISMNNIKETFFADIPGKETLIKANLLVLLCGIENVIKEERVSTPPKSVLSGIIAYVNEHFTENITIEDIAEHFFLSKSQISHSFSKTMGISLKNYITHKKIVYAKELMNTSKSFTEIAIESGFGEYSVFYKAFIKTVGITPSEYRKNI